MVWKFFIFVFLASFLSVFFNPQKEDQTFRNNSIIAAPLPYVRQRLLDFDSMHDFQLRNKIVILDNLRLERKGQLFEVDQSRPGDILQLTNSTGGQRPATVVKSSLDQIIYREDRPWGQRIYHNLTFYTDHEDAWTKMYKMRVTIVSYERQWKGMPVLYMMRQFFPGLKPWIGEGLPEATRYSGIDSGFIAEIQDAWKEIEKARLDRIEEERASMGRDDGPKTLSWKAGKFRDLGSSL